MRNLVKKHQQPTGQGYHSSDKDYRRVKMEHDKHFQELKEEHDEENYRFLANRSEN